jgi:pimeloyl-ACP methyl ester carboxylesterase
VTNATAAPEAITHTLDVPGVKLAYDVRKNEATTEPPLFLIGSPMGAAGFGTLAGHFADRTLITYDPRGSERSEKTPDAPSNSPTLHAEDLHRIIAEVGGPVDMFASSGGAINALALVARYPNDVRILVAHEPPTAAVLPDRDEAFAAIRDMGETYQRGGFGPALAKFIALTSHQGPIPADWTDGPAPDPQMFGLPTDDDGSRNDPLFTNLIPTTSYEPDFDALRSAPTRVILAAGVESDGQMASRAAHEIAAQLQSDVIVFPSHHGGFLGGEYGQAGDPDAFAAKLREVLDDAA